MLVAPFIVMAVAPVTLLLNTLEIPVQVGFEGHENRMMPPERFSGAFALYVFMQWTNGVLLMHRANEIVFQIL